MTDEPKEPKGKTILLKGMPLEVHARYRGYANAKGMTMPEVMLETLALHAPRAIKRLGYFELPLFVGESPEPCVACQVPGTWLAVERQSNDALRLVGPYCPNCANFGPKESESGSSVISSPQ